MPQQQPNTPQINRRKFISSLGLISGFTVLKPFEVFSFPDALSADASVFMKCKPYLQAAATDQITIRWITNFNCYCWVEYGENPDNLNLKAQRVYEGLVQANNTIQDITLENLQPGKTYYYRAVSKKIPGFNKGKVTYSDTFKDKVYAFTTPKGNMDIKSASFLVFNDIHDRPESFGLLMKYQSPGKKDFVFLNGDMFNSLQTEDQIVDHLLNPLSNNFATETPFIYGRGNHEDRGPFARQLDNYIDGKGHPFYYSFQYGPLYCIVLDSGEDKADTEEVYGGINDFDDYRHEQRNWLLKEVEKKEFKNARFRVVFNHIPLYHTAKKDPHGAVNCRENWGDILNKSKISLMISGHTHVYKIHQPIAGMHNYPIVVGGGPFDGQRTIIEVNVDEHQLNLTMTDDSGKVVGTLNL